MKLNTKNNLSQYIMEDLELYEAIFKVHKMIHELESYKVPSVLKFVILLKYKLKELEGMMNDHINYSPNGQGAVEAKNEFVKYSKS